MSDTVAVRRFRSSWIAQRWIAVVVALIVVTAGLVWWTRARSEAGDQADPIDCGRLQQELHRLSGSVRAIDGTSGHVLWQSPTGWTDTRPSAGDRQVLVVGTDFGGPDTQVAALDEGQGSVRWRHDLGRARPLRPLPAGDVVLVPVVRLLSGTSAAPAPSTSPGPTNRVAIERSPDADRFASSVVVLDAATGNEIRTLPYRIFGSPESVAALPGGTAVLARDAHVALVELRTGAERWSIDLDAANADPPTIVEGVVTLRDIRGTTYGMDLVTGKGLWRHDGDVSTRLAENRGARGAAVVLVVGRDTLAALDPRTGERAWELKATVTAELYVGEDGLIGLVVTPPDQPFGTKLLLVDSSDGRVAWTVDAGTRITPRLASGDNLVVALVGDPAKLVAYDRSSGTERWRADLGDALPPSLTFAGGRFVAATEGGAVRAFTKDGRDAWIDSSSRNEVNPPVTDGNALYVSASTPLDRRTDDLESFFLRC